MLYKNLCHTRIFSFFISFILSSFNSKGTVIFSGLKICFLGCRNPSVAENNTLINTTLDTGFQKNTAKKGTGRTAGNNEWKAGMIHVGERKQSADE